MPKKRETKLVKITRDPEVKRARLGRRERKQTWIKGRKTGGRQAGTPNKLPGLLKDALIEAAELAGSRIPRKNREAHSNLVAYLAHQATYNPQSFLPLLGRVLPLQIDGDGKNIVMIDKIEMVVLRDGRIDDEGDVTRAAVGDDDVLTSIEGTSEVLAPDRPGQV